MANFARNENESFPAYKQRLSAQAYLDKNFKRGVLFWDSYNEGTYENKEKQAKRAAKGKW